MVVPKKGGCREARGSEKINEGYQFLQEEGISIFQSWLHVLRVWSSQLGNEMQMQKKYMCHVPHWLFHYRRLFSALQGVWVWVFVGSHVCVSWIWLNLLTNLKLPFLSVKGQEAKTTGSEDIFLFNEIDNFFCREVRTRKPTFRYNTQRSGYAIVAKAWRFWAVTLKRRHSIDEGPMIKLDRSLNLIYSAANGFPPPTDGDLFIMNKGN